MNNAYIDTNTLIYLGKSGTAALNGLLATGETIVITDVVFYEAVLKGGLNANGTPEFADANAIENWMNANKITTTLTPIGIADAASGVWGSDDGEKSIQQIAKAGETIVSDNAADFPSPHTATGTIAYLNQSFNNKSLSGPAYAAARDEIKANAAVSGIPNANALLSDATLKVVPDIDPITGKIVYNVAGDQAVTLTGAKAASGTSIETANEAAANTLAGEVKAAGVTATETGAGGLLSAGTLGGAVKLLGIAGLGAMVYDGLNAAQAAEQQAAQGQYAAAALTAQNWLARTFLGLSGAEIGSTAGAILCAPATPLASLACSAAGGVIGSVLTNASYTSAAPAIAATEGMIATALQNMAATVAAGLEQTTTGGVTTQVLAKGITLKLANGQTSSGYVVDAANGELVTTLGSDGETETGQVLVTGASGAYSGTIAAPDVTGVSETGGVTQLNTTLGGLSGLLDYTASTGNWTVSLGGKAQAVLTGADTLTLTNNANGTFALETDAAATGAATATQIDSYSTTGGLTQTVSDYTAGGSLTSSYTGAGWVSQSVAVDAAGDTTTDSFASANVLSAQSMTYTNGAAWSGSFATGSAGDPLIGSSATQANGTVTNSNYAYGQAGDPLLSQSIAIPNASLTVLSFATGVPGDPMATEGVTAVNGDTANYAFNTNIIGDPLLNAVTTIPFNNSTYYTWNNGVMGDPLQVIQTRYADGSQLVTDYDFVGGNWNYCNTAYNAYGQVTQYMFQYANGESTSTTLYNNGGPIASQTVTYGWNGAVWDINTAYFGGNYINQYVLGGGGPQIVGGYDPYVPPDPGLYVAPSTSIGTIYYEAAITITPTSNYGGGGDGSSGSDGGDGGSSDGSGYTPDALGRSRTVSGAAASPAASSWDPGANAGTPAVPTALLPTIPPAAETLNSGSGTVTLTGNGGNDTYVIQAGAQSVGIVNGGIAATGPAGTIEFQNGAAYNNLWYLQQGNNLVIDALGTKNQVTVQNWFAAPQSAVATIEDANGLKLDSALQNLIQAMATFSAANPAFNPQTTAHTSLADSSAYGTLAAVDKGSWHG